MHQQVRVPAPEEEAAEADVEEEVVVEAEEAEAMVGEAPETEIRTNQRKRNSSVRRRI